MPCYDGNPNERIVYEKGHDPRFAEIAKRFEKELKAQKKRLDEVTDLLCKTGRARYRKTEIPKEVLQWWDNHCKWDRERGEPW